MEELLIDHTSEQTKKNCWGFPNGNMWWMTHARISPSTSFLMLKLTRQQQDLPDRAGKLDLQAATIMDGIGDGGFPADMSAHTSARAHRAL
eukprot:2077467-Amphidinium_carterae.1